MQIFKQKQKVDKKEDDIELALVEEKDDHAHVPVNHCVSSNGAFNWNDVYSRHH